MTTPLSDERIAEIRERCDKATPGPWSVDEESGDVWVPSIWRSVAIIEDLDLPLVNPAADRAFIAAARQDVPDLLDEVERLRALVRDHLYGLRTEVARLRDRNAELVAVLRSVEWGAGTWVYDDDGGHMIPTCPRCLAEKREDHAPDCALDAALRGADE